MLEFKPGGAVVGKLVGGGVGVLVGRVVGDFLWSEEWW